MTMITLEIHDPTIEIIDPDQQDLIDAAPVVVPSTANNDAECIDLWLHGRPALTASAYRADVAAFQRMVPSALRQVALADLQRWAETITEMSPATQRRKLAAVKSLLTFGHRIGYLAFDVGRPLRLPKVKDTLSERILDEAEVQLLIPAEN